MIVIWTVAPIRLLPVSSAGRRGSATRAPVRRPSGRRTITGAATGPRSRWWEIVIASTRGLDFDALQMRLHPAASRVARLARETPSSFVAFDLLAIWKRNPVLGKAACYNLIGAALTAPVAIASGLTAWQWQLEGAKLKGNLLLHLLFALGASGMIWLLCAWRISQRKLPQRRPGLIYMLLAFATVLLIAVAGHLGGFVSGVESGNT